MSNNSTSGVETPEKLDTENKNSPPAEPPLQDLTDSETKTPSKKKKRGVLNRDVKPKEPKMRTGKRRKTSKNQVLRIEDLEQALENSGSDIDPETVISMYLPHRRAKRLAAALLRVDRLQLILLGMLLAVAVLFIMAFMQEKMGNFTINLNRLELYRRGISIAETGNFDNPTARLTASTVQDATNVSISDFVGLFP